MPRISAASVAEHVARQHATVLGTAIEMFVERGYATVTLADIAKRVGLARSSLYRYFPDKAHILLAWFEAAMTPLLADSIAIAARHEPAEKRLRRWIGRQLDFLLDPQHDLMIQAALNTSDLPAQVHQAFAERHAELYASLGTILGDAGLGRAAAERRASLIVGLIRSGADLHRRGSPRATVATEVTAAALAVAAI